jgi:predicted deacylase
MPLPPIELQAPDIRPFAAGNTGVPYVHRLDSGQPGPTVMVQALTHGNELCGALALQWLFSQPLAPLRGSLVLAFANVAAFERFDPAAPHASRCVDEDLNRVWADDVLFGPRDSVELRRARELQPFVDAADLLLDIHSMTEPCRPLMVCGTQDKNADFARALGTPADLLIDTGHPAGLRMVERGGFGDPASPRKALLVECGQHWERAATDVAIDTLVRFLHLTGVVDAAWAAARTRLPLPARQQLVRVTEAVVARSTGFQFLVPVQGLGVLPDAGTAFARDGDHVWRTQHDNTVLVMPSTAHVRPGNTMVRIGHVDPS